MLGSCQQITANSYIISCFCFHFSTNLKPAVSSCRPLLYDCMLHICTQDYNWLLRSPLCCPEVSIQDLKKDFKSKACSDERPSSHTFFSLRQSCRFELGAALFIGWAGSVLCVLGGFIFCLSLSEGFSIRHVARFTDMLDANNVIPHLSSGTRRNLICTDFKLHWVVTQSGNLNNNLNDSGEMVTVKNIQ